MPFAFTFRFRAARACCLLLAGFISLGLSPQMPAQTTAAAPGVNIRGRVTDAKTGEGIAKALVSVRSQKLEAVTDAAGEFVLAGVTPGEVELYVSTVGYGLVRKNVQLPDGRDLEIDFSLGRPPQERRDEVTVTAGRYEVTEAGAVSEHTLTNTEMASLAGVMADDPLRSVHTLPGVATSDDFNAHFSLRGAGFSKIGVYLDGVLLDAPFHTIDDMQQTASLTLFNSDAVDSMALLSGGFPARYGERTGAVLDIHTRNGNREKVVTQADLAASGFAFTNEGPIGSKASWLVSGRKSFLDYLLARAGDSTLVIGFSDLQGKVTYQPAPRHEFTVNSFFGTTFFRPGKSTADYAETKRGSKRSAFGGGAWKWALTPSLLLRSQYSYMDTAGEHRDWNDGVPFWSDAHSHSLQQELIGQFGSSHAWQAGWTTRDSHEELRSRYTVRFTDFSAAARYDREAWTTAAYLQDSWQLLPRRLVLNWGGRYERFSPTGESLLLPRAGLSLVISPRDTITLSWGQYGQFPGFRQLWGEVRNPGLHAERGTHYIAGFEHRLTENVRFRVEAYNVRHREGIYSPYLEFRRASPADVAGLAPDTDTFIPPWLENHLRNSLTGYSRGVEFFLQRRSANRLSGWISYAYSHTRYQDAADGLSFDGDYDQRHTLNVYGSYRFSKAINLSAKYRYGSNFPIPGFFQRDGNNLALTDQRNLVRLPAYSRLDLRIDKAFYLKRRKLTLYAEANNVFNRGNTGCRVSPMLRLAPACDSGFPILPAAGLKIEF